MKDDLFRINISLGNDFKNWFLGEKMIFPDASQNLSVSLANDGLQRRGGDEQSRAHRQGALEDLW